MAKKKGSVGLNIKEKSAIKTGLASGKTVNKVSKELQRSNHTVKRFASEPAVIRSIQEIKEELAGMFTNLAERLIASIDDESIAKINAYQRTIAAGVCTDKAGQLRLSIDRLAGFGGNYLASVCIALDAQQRAEHEQTAIIEIEGGE